MYEPNSPKDLEWIEGELPDVHLVPRDCYIVAWLLHDYPDGPEGKSWQDLTKNWPDAPSWDKLHGRLRTIELVRPFQNNLNSLKWCNNSGMPIGYQEKVKYWAWVKHPMYIGKNLKVNNVSNLNE